MEISANELRIGNIVSHYGFIRKIEAIHPKNKLTDKHRRIEFENGVSSFLMSLRPIELSENWLLRFGFEKKEFECPKLGYGLEYYLQAAEDVFFCFQEDFSLQIFNNKVSIDVDSSVMIDYNFTKYVHQFQNIYFGLVGKELFIELERNELDKTYMDYLKSILSSNNE